MSSVSELSESELRIICLFVRGMLQNPCLGRATKVADFEKQHISKKK